MANTSVKPPILDDTGKDIVSSLQTIAQLLMSGGGGEIPEDLNDATWEQIGMLIGAGAFADHYKVGDTKAVKVKFDNDQYNSMLAIVAGIDTYAPNTVDFILYGNYNFSDPNQAAGHAMIPNSPCSVNYLGLPSNSTSDMYNHDNRDLCMVDSDSYTYNNFVNHIIESFPESLQNILTEKVAKYPCLKYDIISNGYNVYMSTKECANKVWIPTYYELYGEDYVNSDGTLGTDIESKYMHHYDIPGYTDYTIPLRFGYGLGASDYGYGPSGGWLTYCASLVPMASSIRHEGDIEFVENYNAMNSLAGTPVTYAGLQNARYIESIKLESITGLVYGFTSRPVSHLIGFTVGAPKD